MKIRYNSNFTQANNLEEFHIFSTVTSTSLPFSLSRVKRNNFNEKRVIRRNIDRRDSLFFLPPLIKADKENLFKVNRIEFRFTSFAGYLSL